MRLVARVNLVTAMHVVMLVGTIALFFSVRSMPLLSTFGFESANLLVTVFGPLFCLAAALNFRSKVRGYGQIFLRELWWLTANLMAVCLVLFINGFYVKSCSTGAGFIPFITIALPPLLLNISIGVILASVLYRSLIKFIVFILGYFAYALIIALSWWHEATFRVLTHASILMTSDLLTGDTFNGSVVGFRVATLFLALAIITLGVNFLGNVESRVFDKKVRHPLRYSLMISVLLIGHLCLTYLSVSSLGPSLADLKKDYDLLASNESFLIYGDAELTSIEQANEILFEANFYQAKIAKRLGPVLNAPITIWLHHSNDEKYRYTGAKNVHFALPKHRTIHVTGYNTPHDVLGHELAHIYVGEQSRTIFGFPGKGYFIPNLAMTEGLAMLLSKELNITHDLTLIEQAQAMYQANIRVDINDLFSDNPMHFALAHPRAAYVYAGATLDFLLRQINENDQPEKLRRLINDGDLAQLFSSSDASRAHIASFAEKLKEPIPERARRWAQKTFQQASILATNCSDQVSHERVALERSLLNHDSVHALVAIKKLPVSNQAQLLDMALERMLMKKHYQGALDFVEQREQLAKLTHAEAAELMLKRIQAMIGLHQIEQAKALLDTLNDEYFFSAERRYLQALRIYTQAFIESPELKPLCSAGLSFLLAKIDQFESLPMLAFHLGKDTHRDVLHAPRVNWLSTYLLARFHMQIKHYEDALHQVTLLLPDKELVANEMEKEVQTMFASLNQSLGNYSAALTAFQSLLNENNSECEKLLLEDRIERVYSKMKIKDLTH